MEKQGWKIKDVKKGSIADQIGLEKGDRVSCINCEKFKDVLDYRYLCADEELELEAFKENGDQWLIDIEKDYDEDLGIMFESPTISPEKRCSNRCIFCFIDQMPKGMRSSLYVKDDDYRLSFLHGNFITLTNLTEREIERIEKQHLSPLYVSVHTTDPVLREKMVRCNQGRNILETLKRLASVDIEMHGQVVLCPGINDGTVLNQTIKDLAELWPSFKSLAVVPVGITRYRENQFPLTAVTSQGAQDIIESVGRWQAKFLKDLGTRFVFPADEFFLKAGIDIPLDYSYEEYPQTENGVGLIRILLNNLEKWTNTDLPLKLSSPVTVSLVTGNLAKPYIEKLAHFFNTVENLKVKVWDIENIFFGKEVTVSGLICGKDMIDSLSDKELGDLLIIPDVMVRDGKDLFLDDYTREEIEDILQVKTKVINSLLEGVTPFDLFSL
ncbi:DUF512 domain-containing protein [Candidatus Contubernalis alkaliaceticus]|uniref:DUF512 domain-containing protein n=1 Tax=Candidatus Contubernalis alkaliaceticus TaxID=338645 RepID=UPI001F4BDCD0|nr:DUF512 domain-containing protein [Candidatus Contubernalis alkalaceticus]UNC92473.1 DUF512 domain-containing protein [Candidatus Contubernalis alkalaceticus]